VGKLVGCLPRETIALTDHTYRTRAELVNAVQVDADEMCIDNPRYDALNALVAESSIYVEQS
jgi:hypothetical protein